MSVNPAQLAAHPVAILGIAVGLFAAKSLLVFGLARRFRLSKATALETAIMVGPGGEFAFVLLNGAVAAKLLAQEPASLVLAGVSLTMVALPLLARMARALTLQARRARHPARRGQGAAAATIIPPAPSSSAAAASASSSAAMLEEHNKPYIVIDSDAVADHGPAPRGPAGLLRRRHQAGFPAAMRSRRGDGADRDDRQLSAPSTQTVLAARALQARSRHRRPRPRRGPCAPSLRDRRQRRGAGDHRGQPAAIGSGARRARRADGLRHRLGA